MAKLFALLIVPFLYTFSLSSQSRKTAYISRKFFMTNTQLYHVFFHRSFHKAIRLATNKHRNLKEIARHSCDYATRGVAASIAT